MDLGMPPLVLLELSLKFAPTYFLQYHIEWALRLQRQVLVNDDDLDAAFPRLLDQLCPHVLPSFLFPERKADSDRRRGLCRRRRHRSMVLLT
jgi:hypothetical protein